VLWSLHRHNHSVFASVVQEVLPETGVSRCRWKTGKSVEETWFVELDQEERVRRLTARHLHYDQDAAIAELRATGNDETNAALVALGAKRSTLVITNSDVKRADVLADVASQARQRITREGTLHRH
jgi:dephospho-CoA kinase